MASAVCFSVSASRPVMMTFAPRSAKPWAIACPMPRLPPETNVTRFFTENKSCGMNHFLVRGLCWADQLGVYANRKPREMKQSEPVRRGLPLVDRAFCGSALPLVHFLTLGFFRRFAVSLPEWF